MVKAEKFRSIFALLTALGVFSAVAVLGSAYWLSNRFDTIENLRARSVVKYQMSTREAFMARMVEDHAWWDHAFDIVKTGSAAVIYRDLASSIETMLFDEVFLFTGTGEMTHQFVSDRVADGPGADPSAIAQFVNRLRRTEPQNYVVVCGFDGGSRIIAAAWITPEHTASVAPEDHPILVLSTVFTDALLAEIARESQLTGLRLRPGPSGDQDLALDVAGADGTVVAHFAWMTPQSGTILRNAMMPALLAFVAAVFAVCVLAARYFHQQGKLLRTARKIARTDPLTGLLNRAGLEAVLASWQVSAALKAGNAALLYLDLNALKHLNDSLGHAAGDVALKVTARRLERAIGPHGTAIRLGGDEFAALITGSAPRETAGTIAEAVCDSFERPIRFATQLRVMRVSVGVCVATPGMDQATLFSNADAAMYRAKQTGCTTPVFHAPDLPHTDGPVPGTRHAQHGCVSGTK